ncbi:MAG TPA: hypothetical protein VK604_24435 [Bryobacteraceae bacterium]|nr:hypothetical protein [Bryobacteraceae bacterium]
MAILDYARDERRLLFGGSTRLDLYETPRPLHAEEGVDPTLTLVANSLYAELESCEVGAASLSNGGSVRPGGDAQQVDGCCSDDMLQVGFGKSAIATAA